MQQSHHMFTGGLNHGMDHLQLNISLVLWLDVYNECS